MRGTVTLAYEGDSRVMYEEGASRGIVCVLQSTISRKGRTPWAHGTRTLAL